MARMFFRWVRSTVVDAILPDRRLPEVPPIVLSARDAQRVVDALVDPPRPNPALEKAALEYQAAISSGQLVSR